MHRDTSKRIGRSPVQITIGLAVLGLGLFYLYTAVNIRTPPVGDLLGPRFFPLMLGVLFVLLAGLNIAADILRPADEGDEFKLERDVKLRTVLVYVGALIYGLALPVAGYIASTFVFVLAFLTLLKFRRTAYRLIAAALVTIGFYLVFDLWLGVKLPETVW